ncbi:MAG: hypothetical protein ACXU86_08565 [Archangium sp.]
MDPILKKLRLKAGQRVLVLDPPESYAPVLAAIPAHGAELVKSGAGELDFVHAFVTTRAELERLGPKLRELVKPEGLLWVSYPKGKALPTDINRDSTRETLARFGLEAVSQVAIDEIWSALRFKKL